MDTVDNAITEPVNRPEMFTGARRQREADTLSCSLFNLTNNLGADRRQRDAGSQELRSAKK